MFHLHCTRKLLDRLGHQPTSVPESTPASTLGHWYATVLFWRPQVVLCVNELTLLPVLMPLAPAATLPARLPGALAIVLQAHGWDAAKIDAEMQHMRECEIAKTANRSVVGTLNEFALPIPFGRSTLQSHQAVTESRLPDQQLAASLDLRET